MAAVRPAGPEPMIRTLDDVRPAPSVPTSGPPGTGAAAGASAIIEIAPPSGAAPAPPPKLILSPPKGLAGALAVPFVVPSVASPPGLVVSVIVVVVSACVPLSESTVARSAHTPRGYPGGSAASLSRSVNPACSVDGDGPKRVRPA